MREYEIHVFAGYDVNGTMKYNTFKEYIEAENRKEAEEILKEKLEAEGYRDIEMETFAA